MKPVRMVVALLLILGTFCTFGVAQGGEIPPEIDQQLEWICGQEDVCLDNKAQYTEYRETLMYLIYSLNPPNAAMLLNQIYVADCYMGQGFYDYQVGVSYHDDAMDLIVVGNYSNVMEILGKASEALCEAESEMQHALCQLDAVDDSLFQSQLMPFFAPIP